MICPFLLDGKESPRGARATGLVVEPCCTRAPDSTVPFTVYPKEKGTEEAFAKREQNFFGNISMLTGKTRQRHLSKNGRQQLTLTST